MTTPRGRIDAHLHLWDLERGEYAWLGEQHGELFASFRPAQAEEQLRLAGIDRAILVQAEDSVADTDYLLEVADDHSWVAGVVGWVQLDEPAVAAAQLDRLTGHPRFSGVRHLVHDDPRADFLALDGVRVSLGLLAERGIPFDVPDAWPRHLAAVRQLAADLPDLTIVVDHLAKPPRGRDDFGAWRGELERVASLPNTVAKLSGMRQSDAEYTVSALLPVWEIALDAFGSERLLWGSDWPVSGPEEYVETARVLDELVDALAPAERDAVLGGNTARVYGLVD